MSVNGIRFRVDGELCVLQVLEYGDIDSDYFGRSTGRKASWRDAKATDLLEVAKFTTDHEALKVELQRLHDRLDHLTQQGAGA